MRLYFLRHGLAEYPRPNLKDAERHLTSEGVAEMKRVALGIKALDLSFDALLTSPYARALETAEILAEALRLPKERFVIEARLQPGLFDPQTLQTLVQERSPQEGLLFVGHEPTLSGNIAWLCGGNVKMRKAGLACVEVFDVRPHGGLLLWLLTPKQLCLIAKAS